MRYRLPIALAVLLMASPASAEVADKEPSLATMWALAVAFNVAAALLSKVRPWAGLLVVPFAASWALAAVPELVDPYVGPAIRDEIGAAYIAQSWLTVILGLLGPVAVVTMSHLARRQKR